MAGLKDKYCIVGIGETAYSRSSGRSTRDLGAEAVRRAMADAGLHPWDVDGMLNYHVGDSTLSQTIATDLGIRLDFYTDTFGGGSSTETIIGLAVGAIEAGMCHTVALYRSMNGYSGLRQGGSPGTVRPPARVVVGPDLDNVPYGITSPAQNFMLTFARHMYEYGTTSEQLAHVKVAGVEPRLQQPAGVLRPAGHRRRRAQLRAGSSNPPATCSTAASRRTTPPASSSPRPIGPATSGSVRSSSSRWPAG